MVVCSAFGCTNRSDRKKSKVSFHTFPSDPQRKLQWIIALKRKNFQPTPAAKVCSDHFLKTDYEPTGRLKANAVPSVFKGFPSHFQKKPINKPKKVTAPLTMELKRDNREINAFRTTISLLCQDESNQSFVNRTMHHESNQQEISETTNNKNTLPVKEEINENFQEDISDSEDTVSCPESENEFNQSLEEEMDENFSEDISDSVDLSYVDKIQLKTEENLKLKLKIMTAMYKRSQKKLKRCQYQCQFHIKQVVALEEVIDNLRQINYVSALQLK